MFNGIIEFIGRIINKDRQYFYIYSNIPMDRIKNGDSISCSGVCLTIINIEHKTFVCEVSDETFEHTNLAHWKINSKTNLELPLIIGDSLNGHFVLGHVDSTARLTAIVLLADGCYQFTMALSKNLMQYIVYKGSVTIDGVSLTINKVLNNTFFVNLLPYTWHNTTFQFNKTDDLLNIEIDSLARYANKNHRSI